jgi:ATP-dependent DNA helicase RecQ
VTEDEDGYGGLCLTAKARPLLRGEEKLWLRQELKPEGKAVEKKYERTSRLSFRELDKVLWEKLRAKRLELAQNENVPPYYIFHDSTLAEMVKYRPRDLDEFARLSGVGKYKLGRYAQPFLEILQTWQDSPEPV